MCTRFVYNGIDKIVGFNFDIDLSVWDHTVITEENRFYIGIKMPDGIIIINDTAGGGATFTVKFPLK